jgi:glycerol uptake facilitator-like aquaporin
LGFVIELVFFGLFVFLILFLGWRVKKTKVASLKIRCQLINSFIISFGLFVIVSVQIPLTGASCNAFRSLAPLIFESWSTHSIIGWIQFPWYLMSTIVGAQLAAIIFNRSLNKR